MNIRKREHTHDSHGGVVGIVDAINVLMVKYNYNAWAKAIGI